VVHNCGTLRQVRLPYQELLPLKGKPVNTYGKMQETKMLANNEIQSLLTMVGFDIRNPDNWEPRVGKVIVAADNDDDGKHIAALLMAFFHKYAPRMLERNMVYVAVTPEYVIKAKSTVHFAYDHPTAIQLLTDHGGTIHHIKGLCELNKDLLYESGVNPATRKLWRIISNPENDASRIVEILGESPEARKRLLGLA
jgi:DNA gyrase/topoisomerase IV subunit B